VTALGQQVDIELAQQQSERIRILGFLHQVARPVDAQAVGAAGGDDAGEQARGCSGCSVASRAPPRSIASTAQRRRQVGAHHAAARARMRAEQRKRIADATLDQRTDQGRIAQQFLVHLRRSLAQPLNIPGRPAPVLHDHPNAWRTITNVRP
jgi:hypothetical protein